MNRKLLITFLIILPWIVSNINCQNELSIFDDLIGSQWIGHYQESEDSLLTHLIKWEYDLDNNTVVQTKQVPEINFTSKIYYFKDFETDTLSYLALMNKKIISRGTASCKDGMVILKGFSFFAKGSQENKQTFNISDSGELQDRFFRKKNEKWLQGHYITYVKKEKK